MTAPQTKLSSLNYWVKDANSEHKQRHVVSALHIYIMVQCGLFEVAM